MLPPAVHRQTDTVFLCLPIVLFGEVFKNGGCSFFLQSISVDLVFLSAKLIYYWLPSISFQAVSPGFDSKPSLRGAGEREFE